MTKCAKCGQKIGDGFISPKGWCVDCFSDVVGEIVEEYPIYNPETDDVDSFDGFAICGHYIDKECLYITDPEAVKKVYEIIERGCIHPVKKSRCNKSKAEREAFLKKIMDKNKVENELLGQLLQYA